MRRFDTVLFDLDGTLTDSGPGIIKAVEYALNKFDITVTDRQSLRAFVGPPLRDSFSRFYGFSAKDAERAVAYYREYYNDTGVYENSVYEGIPEALKALKDEGYTLAVATSKPETLSVRVLDHFDLSGYFKVVSGASEDASLYLKADVIRQAMRRLNLSDTEGLLMVGDREHDVIGAKDVGIPCLGVLFGYGDREELTAAGAAALAKTAADIVRFVRDPGAFQE